MIKKKCWDIIIMRALEILKHSNWFVCFINSNIKMVIETKLLPFGCTLFEIQEVKNTITIARWSGQSHQYILSISGSETNTRRPSLVFSNVFTSGLKRISKHCKWQNRRE